MKNHNGVKMLIGVISDLHLGNRQYGLIDREKDFYNQYIKCMKELMACDLIIIAGDVFDKPNPSPEAISVFQQGLLMAECGPVCGVKGNHTMLKRKNHIAADEIFGDLYTLLTKDKSQSPGLLDSYTFDYKNINGVHRYELDQVHLYGIDYCGAIGIDKFKKRLAEIVEVLDDNYYNILVTHEAFSEYCGFSGEPLSYNDINFGKLDLVITGHIHSRFIDLGVKPIFLQPGSIERLNTAEAQDESNIGKGVWKININKDLEASFDFVRIESSRKFFLEEWTISDDITLDSIKEKYKELQDEIDKEEEKPIVSHKIYANNFDIIRDFDNNLKNCLLVSNKYYDTAVDKQIKTILNDDGTLPSIRQVLEKRLKLENYSEFDKKVALELYDVASKNQDDLADSVSLFYNTLVEENKKNYVETETTNNEINKLYEYFE